MYRINKNLLNPHETLASQKIYNYLKTKNDSSASAEESIFYRNLFLLLTILELSPCVFSLEPLRHQY